jgi:hypothetical protein
MSITYSECVSAASVIQHAKRMCHIIVPPVARQTTTFLHIISLTARFSGKVTKYLYEMHALIFFTIFV